ncbi:phosphoglycerate mutase family protein [Streptosporangium sandarakinum]|uniref:Broad specificity phosphatase PhoE n=1 Tax=Streptosporangium sandarakinum TaxID=1260955 RepID=A0A852UUP1_9ACTN|nr:histidine phosphatase family protein [Streptosporangium sandarakinum]NYF41022.1 broad specificity phosphatase PhoE [Streptosporangium sandarakinum]
MRWLDVRRHSLTKKGAMRGRGSHLSADGIALARFIGSGVGPYERVVTGSSPRAVETAVAMGFAVDDTVEMPSGYVSEEIPRHAQWDWAEPYRQIADIIRKGRTAAAVAETHRAIWAETVNGVAEGGSALLVGHGGAIELALVACLPDAPHDTWGTPFAHCDGVRLGFTDGHFVSVEFHRVRQRPPLPN